MKSIILRTIILILFPFISVAQECNSHFPWILSDVCGYAPVVLWSFPECTDDEELIFEDNFDTDSIDKSKWGESWLRSSMDGGTVEYATFENILISNGICHLIAKRDTIIRKAIPSDPDTKILPDGKQNLRTYFYSSGALHSMDTFNYGKFEVRFRVPEGQGLWPAIWMFGGQRWNEIDMLDGYSGINNFNLGAIYDYNNDGCYAHEGESCGKEVKDVNPNLKSWHTVTFINDWYQSVWLLDGTEIHTENRFETTGGKYLSCGDEIEAGSQFNARKNLPMEMMHVIINLQIGSEHGASGPVNNFTVFPASFDIDYIRIWQRKFVNTRLVISPNPNSGKFLLSLSPSQNGPKKVTIFDLVGKEVGEYTSDANESIEIDELTLPRGFYICKLKYADFNVSGIVIIK
jgi:hypothetical protein